ncbi:MAG TPA: alpha-glucuronidase [Candidatus Pelethocola excrementipullorum]|nr:alpha-glucuronidase [Candidatus Pelethocola excrementipullorum]
MNYEKAWLSYRKRCNAGKHIVDVFTNAHGIVAKTAASEMMKAVEEILGNPVQETTSQKNANISLLLDKSRELGEEGYELKEVDGRLVITSGGENGLLYGTFAFIRSLQCGKSIKEAVIKKPSAPFRMLNHWDNIDGSIERGYSGESFFFKDQKVLVDDRTRAYARLAASIGINAVVINNVNVKGNATRLIDQTYENEIRQMTDIFTEYGIKLYMSLNFAAPMELEKLDSADPCDEKVRQWWKDKMKELYSRLPELGGFLVKADSEGRPGPFTYGRTHADGANMLAEAVAPYGGTIIWRCFVYNCQQDWRDQKTDRAKSGYDNFMPLDGQFRDNVILQIKNGPMDFQVREPISPLFGGLEHTNQMLEVQIAQEYTGQQRHVCYLIPMFKEILGFHTYCKGENDTVRDIITGKTFSQNRCGIAAVANMGNDENWTGHDLAAANLYGFGRLSFEMDLTAEEIAEEWIGCTYGGDQEVQEKIMKILMMSWPAYEKYTSPLGIGWMVNPNHHYGPNVDGYEYDRWGTYHRADHKGIGVERGSAGTGYVQQYREPNASIYEKIETCPEELLLFFHYIPYAYRLSTGKTLIQHIYDTHFEGVQDVEEMAALWDSLEGKIPEQSFRRVQSRLEHQKSHSKEWRDQVNSYFYRKSMITDEKERTIY